MGATAHSFIRTGSTADRRLRFAPTIAADSQSRRCLWDVYPIRVTLAGYLPAIEQHVEVNSEHATLLQIVLGSVFSSFEKLRRAPDQPVNADDWTWVLRTSAATPARYCDGRMISAAADSSRAWSIPAIHLNQPQLRARLELTSGADHPGSIGDLADSSEHGLRIRVGSWGARAIHHGGPVQ